MTKRKTPFLTDIQLDGLVSTLKTVGLVDERLFRSGARNPTNYVDGCFVYRERSTRMRFFVYHDGQKVTKATVTRQTSSDVTTGEVAKANSILSTLF